MPPPRPIPGGVLGRLCATGVVLVAATAGTMGVLVSRRIERDLLADTRETLRARAALLLPLASSVRDPAELEARFRALGERTRTRLTVVAPDGRVLADSHEDPSRMENHAGRPEILDAVRSGLGVATRHSATVGERMMYVAVRAGDAGAPGIVARAAVPLTDLDERLAHVRRVTAAGAAAGAGLAAILGVLLARRIAVPLRAITRAAEALARGAPATDPLPAESRDEIGTLARSFREMDAQLRARMENLAASRDLLGNILGSMEEGVVAVDARERIVHLNAAARRMLDTPPGDVEGRPLWELTRIRDLCEAVGRTARQGQIASAEIHPSDPARERTLHVTTAPLRDAAGAPAGAVAVLQDLTRLRHLETVRRDFVANVSHELKTPLTAIRGSVETVLDDPAMDPAARERFLRKTLEQTERLSALVSDLLSLARAESGEPARATTLLDLRDPVAEALRGMEPAARARRHALESDLPGAPVPVRGDAQGLRQAVANLLENAIKYTPEGGRISVRVAARGERAVLEVADTGIGIEPADQERIFERFYRVDKARSRDQGGTGLGLSIVKHVALTHGGEVTVESAPGRGSTFRLFLPL